MTQIFSENTKVLKELTGITHFGQASPEAKLNTVMIVDTETTGIDLEKDEIIQLAFNLIEFDTDGNFYKVLYQFSSYQDTNREINPDSSKITSITKETIQGKSIDRDVLGKILDKTDVVVAFNAEFDRAMLEKLEPKFAQKYFACAMKEIPYLDLYGFKGSQELLLQKICNVYYDSHDALMDVNALSYLLSQKVPNSDKTLFYVLIKMSQAPKTRIYIRTTKFLDNDLLKENGFSYNPKNKMYFKDVKPTETEAVKDFVTSINAEPVEQVLNGFNKFK